MNATLIPTAALIRDTFREAFARRIFWGFAESCCTLLLAFLVFIMRIDACSRCAGYNHDLWPRHADHRRPGSGSANAKRHCDGDVFLRHGALRIRFGRPCCSGISSEPGRIELLLSKPVSRTRIPLGRYLGNLLVVAANIVYLTVGSWMIFRNQDRRLGRWLSALQRLHDFHFCGSAGCDRFDRRPLGERGGGHHGHLRDHDRDTHSGPAGDH